MSTVTKPLGFLARAGLWAVAAAGVAVLIVAVLLPRVTGSTPYTVLTGSMTPSYSPGALVVVRPTSAEDIQVGDVITYQLESGQASVVTHRVIGTEVETTTGEQVFRTQGDANPNPDPELVRPVQVRGEVWYGVPHLGRLGTVATGEQREHVNQVLAGALVAYAAFLLARSYRSRQTTTRRTA